MTKSCIFSPRGGELEPDTNNDYRNDKEDKVDMSHKRNGIGKLEDLHPDVVESAPGADVGGGPHHVERNNCFQGEDDRKIHPGRGVGHGKGHKRNCNIKHNKTGIYIPQIPLNKGFLYGCLIHKESLPNHKKNIPTIIPLKVWTSISDLPTLKIFVQTFLFGKSMAQKYSTYLQFGKVSKLP